MEIKVNDNNIEKALKDFKRKLQRDGLMGELKKRRFYDKPSVKLKSKRRESQKRKAKSANQRIKRRVKSD